MIYLDYNATTPLDPAVQDAMLPFLGEVWGNPSSIHSVGRRARAFLDESHERVASVLRCKPSEIVFTSGGTESVNMAVLGAARLRRNKGRHIITSTIEHHAVLHGFKYLQSKEGFEVTYIPVNREGLINVNAVADAIRPETTLVSIMAANNEVGTTQPVSAIGEICRNRGVVFHTDAVQSFGKMSFTGVDQFHADLVSICAHKFHGPKGAAVLYIRSPLRPEPLLLGGSHENERRAGTENLAGIIGFTEAIERFVPNPVFSAEHLEPLSRNLWNFIENLPSAIMVGSLSNRLCNTVSFVVPSSDAIALLAALDIEGVCASSGSACSAGSLEPSHVIRAMGLGDKAANSLVRFSLGRETTLEEVEQVKRILPKLLIRVQHSE